MSELQAKGLWSQLKKRNVVRVALVYVFVGLVVIQVGWIASEPPGIPSWSFSLLIVLALLGFPIALALAWVYEVTPQGIRKDSAGFIESIIEIEDYGDAAPSVAVLPFDDLSEKGAQAHYCEGMAEEVLNSLSKAVNLRVVSREAAFQFDSRRADVREVGRKLGVQTVLKGAVRVSGDNLWVSVQQVKTSDASHIWSQQYDRLLKDVFEIQQEITSRVATTLGVSWQPGLNDRQQQVDPEAYDYLLRGLQYFSRHTTQDNVYARQMLKQAIKIEPEYGRAWAGVAYTHGFEYMYFNASNVNLNEAKRASKRALELAPKLASSHVSAGIAHCMSQNYKKAAAEFEQAIRLDPKDYEAWYFFGRTKVHEGDLNRALKLFERASRVRPEDFQSVLLQVQLYTSLDQKGKALEVTREGIERVKSVLELNPNNNRALNMGAFALLRLGQAEEAEKWMSASMSNAPMDSIIQYNGACFFSLSGDVEHALDCLEHCLIKVGNISREWLVHDSDMDNIRDHPRYEEIIRSFPE